MTVPTDIPSPPNGHGVYLRAIAVLVILVVVLGGGIGYLLVNPANTSGSISQTSDLRSQVDTLRSQVSSLQSQLAQFDNVNIKTDITFSNDCPIFSNCSYTLSGSYANFGRKTATSTIVDVVYWSGSEGTGQQLCSIRYSLGDIPGLSVQSFPSRDCEGSTSTRARSTTWDWNWS